jgi:hypothetical protein
VIILRAVAADPPLRRILVFAVENSLRKCSLFLLELYVLELYVLELYVLELYGSFVRRPPPSTRTEWIRV